MSYSKIQRSETNLFGCCSSTQRTVPTPESFRNRNNVSGERPHLGPVFKLTSFKAGFLKGRIHREKSFFLLLLCDQKCDSKAKGGQRKFGPQKKIWNGWWDSLAKCQKKWLTLFSTYAWLVTSIFFCSIIFSSVIIWVFRVRKFKIYKCIIFSFSRNLCFNFN